MTSFLKARGKKPTIVESTLDLITEEVSELVNELLQEILNSKTLKIFTKELICTTKITQWKNNFVFGIYLVER